MANRGYDVVVDVDTEVSPPALIPLPFQGLRLMWDELQGDLGHTDLQDDDLEFHSSSELYLAVTPLAFWSRSNMDTRLRYAAFEPQGPSRLNTIPLQQQYKSCEPPQ